MHIGSREQHIAGLYWRIFERDEDQSFQYYHDGRFTRTQKKELLARYVLRERRQYKRGLIGWLPSHLVSELIKYII
jgi:hypothetical protein